MPFSIKVMVKIDGTCIQTPLTFGLCALWSRYSLPNWLMAWNSFFLSFCLLQSLWGFHQVGSISDDFLNGKSWLSRLNMKQWMFYCFTLILILRNRPKLLPSNVGVYMVYRKVWNRVPSWIVSRLKYSPHWKLEILIQSSLE